MKTFITMAVCFSIIFSAVVSLSESDEICCAWFNLKHIEGNFPQKIMFHYDGTYATYQMMNSSNVFSRRTYQITKKWSDSKGSIWYNIIMHDSKQGKQYQLARISQNGRKLEFICKEDNYPMELKPDQSGYCSYLRAAMDYQGPP